ncbi:MAG: hypothetical protein D6B26_00555 [Spirochaetaceae bacterium]|nr:MAG: hypothetical protein D6B26_00555 [Spirochaetaceae bacterium]
MCFNCRHYDQGAAYQCREAISEPISDKKRGNHCEHFQLPLPGEAVRGVKAGQKDEKIDKARQDLNKLFGGG